VTIERHCNLKASRLGASRYGVFLAQFALRMCRNCYCRAFDQTFDIIVRFSEPDYL